MSAEWYKIITEKERKNVFIDGNAQKERTRGWRDRGRGIKGRTTVTGEEDAARDRTARTMKRGSLVTLRRQPRSYGILLVPLPLFNNALSQSRVLFTRFRKYSRVRKKGRKKKG